MIQEVSVKYQDNLREIIPMGKFGSPENILIAVKYLIESDYITGPQLILMVVYAENHLNYP